MISVRQQLNGVVHWYVAAREGGDTRAMEVIAGAHGVRLKMKRAFDIAVASVGVLLLSPVIAITGALVRLTIGKPVLFRQLRPGLNGRPFRICKFRTMRDIDSAENQEPLPDAMRLTRLGRFLRSTSLDELPELWNVLRGDMSLVGPRPLLMEYLDLYTAEQRRRHEVRPGITGWAQVNGRNAVSWDEKLRLDVWYVDNHSIVLDLKILLVTLKTVLVREGIAQPGHATMEKFRGSTQRSSNETQPFAEQAADRR